MRTIKFKGKRIDTGKWVYGFLTMGYTVSTNFGDIGYKIQERNEGDHFLEHEIIPETIGQFTGLCDKNGKEIFEGDTISFLYNPFGNMETRQMVVKIPEIYGGYINPETFEITGNMHE